MPNNGKKFLILRKYVFVIVDRLVCTWIPESRRLPRNNHGIIIVSYKTYQLFFWLFSTPGTRGLGNSVRSIMVWAMCSVSFHKLVINTNCSWISLSRASKACKCFISLHFRVFDFAWFIILFFSVKPETDTNTNKDWVKIHNYKITHSWLLNPNVVYSLFLGITFVLCFLKIIMRQ